MKSSTGAATLDLVDKIIEAREEHVRDLRILLDKSAEREAELASMVRMVMEERFYRPSITRDRTKPRQEGEAPIAIPLESLNDVSTFDAESDRRRVEEGEKIQRELEDEFIQILNEHEKAHGLNASSA